MATAILKKTRPSTSSSAGSQKKRKTSSSADLVAGEYEVFLSFRGADTRDGFTDFLYTYLVDASIRTFRDDNELRVGEDIGPELLRAINESKISIPIFSKNYASSKWCLRELAQMVECRANGGQMIYPIFYDVDPSDVQHQRGSYEEAFLLYKKSLDEKTVQRWKEALAIVGDLKGLELKKETNGRQGELVKIIVQNVLTFLKNYKHEFKNLVGMDSHIEKMKDLLNIDSKGVRVIGIHGMGGVGKTTIAKVIYNQLCEFFEGHCFLEDVRENSKRHNGIIHLQNQLLSKILKKEIFKIDGVNDGIRKIKDAVHRKKVFIVLDDVDEKTQIDMLAESYKWFGAQSRIIITTRNEDVLHVLEQTCLREGQLDVYRSYKPELMDNDHSLLLFSKYAFMSDSPPEGFDILSEKVVSTAAGLPLVIVTLGSSLFCETDKALWEEKLRKLNEIPEEDVLEKLRISYDPLDDRQKQIFLDIACFFIGKDKRNPLYMWDDCKFYPRGGLNVLVRRSLITVGDDNTLRMHDQLRDLGRQIVCEGNLNEPGRWSRLWRNDEALTMFKTRQGTTSVKALCLRFQFQEPVHRLLGEEFRQLPNLRYLDMEWADLDGDFKNLLSDLRWLQWWRCSGKFTPTNFRLKNLVILDLSYSEITDEWKGWSQIKMANKLKVLNLSYCYKLIKGPPLLSTFSTLESLEINNCGSLCELDGIKQLESLRYLNTSFCTSLERLSDLSNLRKLEKLNVRGCDKLSEIQCLDKLAALELLDVRTCVKLSEIQGLDKLAALELLDMGYCYSLKSLPDLSNLKKLKKLNASCCYKLIKFQGLDRLESLEHLDITECKSLVRLPDLSNLKELRRLTTRSCHELFEIESLDGLESLEHLDMHECRSLTGLPDLSSLKRLRKLDISGCDMLIEIQGLDKLESLEDLDITECISLKRLPDLSNLKELRRLTTRSCHELFEIESLDGLESLEHLNMQECRSLTGLPDFSNLKNLKEINVSYCGKLTEIRGLEELKSLMLLCIIGCNSLQNLPYLPNTTIQRHFLDLPFPFLQELFE